VKKDVVVVVVVMPRGQFCLESKSTHLREQNDRPPSLDMRGDYSKLEWALASSMSEQITHPVSGLALFSDLKSRRC
jgi:hypothetical protein